LGVVQEYLHGISGDCDLNGVRASLQTV